MRCQNYGLLAALADVVFGTAVQGSLPVWDATLGAFVNSSTAADLAATNKIGALFANTTPATAGVPIQYSPIAALAGTGHDTDGNVSVVENWGLQVRPVNGNTVLSALHFLRSTGGGAYTSVANMNQAGVLALGNGGVSGATGYFSSGLGVYGDRGGGVAAWNIFTNVTTAAGASPTPALPNMPTAATGTWFWKKEYDGTDVCWRLLLK